MQNRAFSLVEVLIAASILIATMLPLWGLLGSSHKQISVSSDEIRASEIAINIIEQIENSDKFLSNCKITFSPKSNSTIVLKKLNNLSLLFAEYPNYLNLSATVEITNYPSSNSNSGKILKLKLKYSPKAKVGKKIKTYEIASYLNRR